MKEILIALNHVKEHYPQVCMVIFSNDGRWQYMDEDFRAPFFDNRIDVNILDDAADNVPTLPFIYQM